MMSNSKTQPSNGSTALFVSKKNQFIDKMRYNTLLQIENHYQHAFSDMVAIEESLLKCLDPQVLDCRAVDLRSHNYDLGRLTKEIIARTCNGNGRATIQSEEDVSVGAYLSIRSKLGSPRIDEARYLMTQSPNPKRQDKVLTSNSKGILRVEPNVQPLKFGTDKKKEGPPSKKWKF